MKKRILALAPVSVLMTGLALAQTSGAGTGASGGTGTPGASMSGTNTTTARHTERDNDFNLGWLGLLGLAGLLRRPKTVVQHDRTTDAGRINTPRV